MSKLIVNRIVALIQARTPSASFEEAGLAILRGVVIDLAQSSADHAFWQSETEPDWTPEVFANLSKTTAEGYAGAIVEIIHRMGGAIDVATDLGEVWWSTYTDRLTDLYASPREGGHA